VIRLRKEHGRDPLDTRVDARLPPTSTTASRVNAHLPPPLPPPAASAATRGAAAEHRDRRELQDALAGDPLECVAPPAAPAACDAAGAEAASLYDPDTLVPVKLGGDEGEQGDSWLVWPWE